MLWSEKFKLIKTFLLLLCYSMTCKWVLGALPAMSIKYYQSYLIHLHKSPSTLSLFLVVPEIGRNTEQIGKSSRHFEGPGSKHSFPDSTDTTGVQLFPHQCVVSRAGLPHRAPTQSVFLIKRNSEQRTQNPLQSLKIYHLLGKRTTIYRR